MNGRTTIYLVRHGQTEWNVGCRFQGHQDSPLTELGIKQAVWLGNSLRNERLDAIYCSSSPRARHTAELIRGSREMKINETDSLKEINLGIWEGQSQEEVKALHPEAFHSFWNDPEKFEVEGGEAFQEVSGRALRKLQHIISGHQGQSILIVTHSVVVKLIMAFFENRPVKEIWNPPYIHPACLCKVEIERNEPKIILHGDISHYSEGTYRNG